MTLNIRIGLHGSNPTLLALGKTDFLQRRLKGSDAGIEWLHLPTGPRAVDYIGADLLDVSGTGSTPPIAGQAKGVPLVYIATSRPRPLGGIAVRADSPIRGLADLKGKRIALAVGSWLQHLLAVALDRGGAEWREIVALDLPDREARQALVAGGIDVWATGNSAADADGKLRFIARTAELVSNPSVFFARRGFAEQHPDLLDAVVQALNDVDRWIETNQTSASEKLAAAAPEADPQSKWRTAVSGRPWGLIPIGDAFLKEQQSAADLYYRFGLLSRKIDVREATLSAPIAIGRAA